MPLIFIKGRFKPEVRIPDGDSVRFLANNPALWKKLASTPVRLDTLDKSKNIAQAPSLKGIEALKTATSNMNWFQTPFLSLWLLFSVALLVTGCNSTPQTIALGAAVATGAGSMIPGHDLEQVYYLGSFDPQEQVPPALYRVRVRGQASLISWMRFGSGWVPAEFIDSLGSSVEINKSDGRISITKAGADQQTTLGFGRRLMQFGPEGFREVPKNHRLVILMGSSPEKFFEAIDGAYSVVSKAVADQESATLNQLLFEAMASARAEKQIVDSQLETPKTNFHPR